MRSNTQAERRGLTHSRCIRFSRKRWKRGAVGKFLHIHTVSFTGLALSFKHSRLFFKLLLQSWNEYRFIAHTVSRKPNPTYEQQLRVKCTEQSSVTIWHWTSWKRLFWVILLQRNAHGSAGILEPFRERGPTSQRGSTALNHTLLITHKGKNTEHTRREQAQADSAFWQRSVWYYSARVENLVQFWVSGLFIFNSAWSIYSRADESFSPFSPPSVTAGQTALSHVSSSVHYSQTILALKAITGNIFRLITCSNET